MFRWFRRESSQNQGVNVAPQNRLMLSEDTVIILVIGSSGSGKSSFVTSAKGDIDSSLVNTSLNPRSDDIVAVLCPVPAERGRRAQQVLLVDTPGLDLGNQGVDTCRIVSSWLNATYGGRNKAGIVYLHKITERKMTDPPARHIARFRDMQGLEWWPKALLATTMWKSNTSDPHLTSRETELKDKYWKFMMKEGGKMAQFHNNYRSAWDIITELLD